MALMTTVEVNEKNWSKFCQHLEEFCRGATVTIELENGDGVKETVARELPLRSLALDEHSDACNTNLIIEAGLPNQKPVRHVVLEPIHIRLRNGNGTDRYNRLQISAENGLTTLELRPGIDQTLLKALQA